MKILYDHQIFTLQKYGGISRYFYELISELDRMEHIETDTSLIVSNNPYISDKKFVKYFDFLPNKQFRGKQRIFNFINKINTIFNLKKQNFDIFHPTYYDPYFLKYLGDKPFVLTVYDMIHEKFSEMFSERDKTSEHKRLLVKKATKIIAISESTKKDLIELFGTDASKIEVVYLGNSLFIDADMKVTISIPEKYILFVGSRGGYKNFDRFIKGVAPLLKNDKELNIVCVGGGKFKSEENELFNILKISNQIIQKDLDDESLSFFYKNALVFVFPSLYEGFGIPVLEAFACKCPLVCSNTSSLPEIAGNGAIYFDPYNEESIKNAIDSILKDEELRNILISKGTEQLKKFSWRKTALQTKKIYESILK
ncbi:glycosyltransferase family 4 protein [Thermodesulfovibrio thiophilus]|uniref:glycosyltransferase family 4 protein n=1 Tax=Thermodesulfovibrio thiophilus TaxID=340095 RepID=UPI0003FFC1EE|nr:glycosyltransferase family 1 protein [Thermodesulfovibrio thiophilus]